MNWENFFRGVDREILRESKVFWTMTSGREHRVQWVCRSGKWGLTKILPPKGSMRASYLSCIHRVPERTRFWKKLHALLGDGGRVLIATQGCQGVYPVPPRLAGSIPDCPSVGTLLHEMTAAGFSSCCAKVHLIHRQLPLNTWKSWLMQGCFSDLDYCDREEIEAFCRQLKDPLVVTMAYYILAGIKLGPQSGIIDIRPSNVHGLSACARQDIDKGWVLLAVPFESASRRCGTNTAEWHHRDRKIGLHRCSTVYRLFNHSPRPNCILTRDGLIHTVRPVTAGEELTLDYKGVA
jgi:hypothetical protein